MDSLFLSLIQSDVVATYLCKHLNWNPKTYYFQWYSFRFSAITKKNWRAFLILVTVTITAYCLGEHGGSAMVPWSHVYVQGKPLVQLQQELPHRFPTLDHISSAR